MSELKSKHLWPLVEQFATTDTSDPENTVPGWVALAMLDDLRRLQEAAPQGQGVPYPIRSVLDAALIVYITECRQVDDPDGEALARQAQQWLDSQRQGQGVPNTAARIRDLEMQLAQAQAALTWRNAKIARLEAEAVDSQRPAPGQEVSE